MSNAFNSINSFLTYTSLLGQQGGGGGGSPSNWSSYPALTNVNLGGNVLSNVGSIQMDTSGNSGLISNARIESFSLDLQGKPFLGWRGNLTASNQLPVFQVQQTDGGGGGQPNGFSLWSGTYIKNDPFGNPTENFTCSCSYTGTDGWIMGAVWESYIGIPFTLYGKPLRFLTEAEGVYMSNSASGGSGTMVVDGTNNLLWNGVALSGGGGGGLTLLNAEQDFAVPISSMVLPIGSTSNFTGSSSSFVPPTTKVIVNAMVSVADGTGMGDFITFGVADSASPSVPLVFTQATIPAGTVITLSVSGVIPVTAGMATTLTLVASSQTNPCYVNNSYSLTITG